MDSVYLLTQKGAPLVPILGAIRNFCFLIRL